MTLTTTDQPTIDQIIGGIVAGDFDADLHRILGNVKARQKRVAVVKSAALSVGDKVRLHNNIKPRYVCGAEGEVREIEKGVVSVYLTDEAVRTRAARYLDPFDSTIRLKVALVDKVEG